MTIPLSLLLVLAVVYSVKHRGSDAPGIILGVCIGVSGAEGWVGDVVRQLLQAVTEAGASLTQVQVL